MLINASTTNSLDELFVPCAHQGLNSSFSVAESNAQKNAHDEVAEQFVRFLEEAGIRTVSLSVGDATTGAEANRFTPREVGALVTQANCTEAGVILVPDTASNTLDYLADLEDVCGKPLLTANQVTVWDVLRVADALRPLPQLGKLLTSPMVPPPNVSV